VRSWTIVDYYLRRTPSFWSVKRALQGVHIVLAEEGDDITVYGINETLEAVSCELRYGIFELAGQYVMDERKDVVLPPNTSTRLASFPRERWEDVNSSLAFGMLLRDGRVIAKNRLALPLMKELRWPKADVKVKVEGGRAVFVSDAFAWGVCLDLDGEKRLEDNMFDLFPGVPHEMAWEFADPPRILRVGNLV